MPDHAVSRAARLPGDEESNTTKRFPLLAFRDIFAGFTLSLK